LKIGAILTCSRGPQLSGQASGSVTERAFHHAPLDSLEILGATLPQRILEQLERVGVERPTVIADTQLLDAERHPINTAFFPAWERAVSQWAQQGAELLLLVRANCYSDMDYADLLRFHLEHRAGMTQVYASDGPVDIALVNLRYFQAADGDYRRALATLVSQHERFTYSGYARRLHAPKDLFQLIEDSFSEVCNLRPKGVEISPGVWLGDGATISSSCTVGSPLFVGSGSRIAASCSLISGAIERGCSIDSGSTVDQAWIWPNTYVGVGLQVRRLIVGGGRILHLDRDTEIAISDKRLIGSTHPLPFRGALLNRFQASVGRRPRA
jgi:hypothetical protein